MPLDFDPQQNKIIDLYNTGATYNALSDATGYGHTRIRTILKKNEDKLTRPLGNRRISYTRVRELYNSNCTVNEIAAMLGRPRASIMHVIDNLTKSDFDYRQGRYLKNNTTEKTIKEATERYLSGERIHALAEEFSFNSAGALRYHIKKYCNVNGIDLTERINASYLES